MNNRLLLLLDPISARMPKLSGNEVMDHVPCPLKSQVATFLPRRLGKQRFFQGIGNLISLRPRRFGKTRIEIRDGELACIAQELLLDMERNREMPAFDTMWKNLAQEVEQGLASRMALKYCLFHVKTMQVGYPLSSFILKLFENYQFSAPSSTHFDKVVT